MKLPNILKQLRLEINASQQDIANKISIPVSTYANWEQGRREPSLTDLIMLSRTFKVSTDYLLGIDNETSKY